MSSNFDLLSKERDTIHRVQECVSVAKTMNVTVLLELIDKLSPDEIDPNEYRMRVVVGYVTNWWNFIGQWEWPLSAVSKKAASSIAEKLIQDAYPDGGEKVDYYDDGIVFASSVSEEAKAANRIMYFVELARKSGKDSLWPTIYVINEFGDASDLLEDLGIKKEDVRLAYGYTTDPNLIDQETYEAMTVGSDSEEDETYVGVEEEIEEAAIDEEE